MPEPVYATYYDSRKSLRDYFLKHARGMGLKSSKPAAVKAWQRRARPRLAKLLGLARLEGCPPRARMTESVDCGDHVRQRWQINTQPGVVMPCYVLSPKKAEGPLPAVICPHGHGGGGKVSPAGLKVSPEVAQSIDHYNYDYGLQYCRAGFRVFCPDARGFGERQEVEVRQQVLASSCHQLALMAAPLGIPVTGLWVFDLMRLADYILSRPDVRPGRLGCAGLSGGGLQTLYFAALDTRVKCAVVSGYFYGVLQSLLEMPNNCMCNMIPHLWESFDMGDVGALIAPRPLLIETGDADPLNGAGGVKNARSQVAIARQAFKALAAAGKLHHDIFPGPHKWHGVQAIPWMQRWLVP